MYLSYEERNRPSLFMESYSYLIDQFVLGSSFVTGNQCIRGVVPTPQTPETEEGNVLSRSRKYMYRTNNNSTQL